MLGGLGGVAECQCRFGEVEVEFGEVEAEPSGAFAVLVGGHLVLGERHDPPGVGPVLISYSREGTQLSQARI